MYAFTIDHPITNSLYKKLQRKNIKIKILADNLLLEETLMSRPFPAQSFFLLPLYFTQKTRFIERIIQIADQYYIPILFIQNRKTCGQWMAPKPLQVIYDILPYPIPADDLIQKLDSFHALHMKMFLGKLREEELESIKRQIHIDFSLAKTIQQFVLPSPLDEPNIILDYIFEPTSKLSGDSFFWSQIDTNTYGIILIDVNGHGIHTALISMSLCSLLQGLLKKVQDPVMITKELNNHMKKLFHELQIQSKHHIPYFTAIIAIINTHEKKMTYVNAGHPPGILYHSSTNTLHHLTKGSMPIGLIDDSYIKEEVIHYEEQAQLLLFTDGLIGTPRHTDIFLWNTLEKMFRHLCDTNTTNLLDTVLRTRMKHSEISDAICILHGILL